MHSNVLISCHLIVWRIPQILSKKDLSFWAGAIKTSSALVALACCILAKGIFYAQQTKRSEKQCTRDWIYVCRFCNLKGCKKWKISFLKKKRENI